MARVSISQRASPAGVTGVKQIAVGYDHACALTMDGKVSCWGYGQYGQLGNGGGDAVVPLPVIGLGG